MLIYLISIILLILFAFFPRKISVLLSKGLIFGQLIIIGRVGGDYDAYIDRGLLSLEDPSILILNEPLTVIFGYASNFFKIPLPNFYVMLTNIILLQVISRTPNRYIYITSYALFIIPVSVGYLRQALVVSILLSMFRSTTFLKFLYHSVFSVIAHPSAFLPVLISGIARCNKDNLIRTLFIIMPFIGLLYIYSHDSLAHFLTHYSLSSQMHSFGYIFRLCTYIAILLIILCIGNQNYINNNYNSIIIKRLGFILIILSVIFYLIAGSTAADRILVYVLACILFFAKEERSSLKAQFIAFISVSYFIGWLSFSPQAHSNWQYETIFSKVFSAI